jgi:hypothetical protein
MKKLTILFCLVLFTINAQAEIIKFRAPALSGKINSETIDLTDWQAVMICHFNLGGKAQESMKYPLTQMKKIDESNYLINVKAMNLIEALPSLEITNCAYKLILIGKLGQTRQNLFGEIYLYGTEQRKMTEKEIEVIQNKELLSKTLNERIKELSITTGPDGGIINNRSNEE